jgi:DNA repair ATPase RecN
VTTVRLLDRKDQVAELARMVGGTSVTTATRRHAEELLVTGQAGSE